MVGTSGKPYTVVGAIDKGVVGYRKVGKQGRYRVRVEVRYPLSLPKWVVRTTNTPVDDFSMTTSVDHYSVTVGDYQSMVAAVSFAFAALLAKKAQTGDFLSTEIDTSKKVSFAPYNLVEEEKEEEEDTNKEHWCEDCQDYHYDD